MKEKEVQKSIVWKEVEEQQVETWWKPEQINDSIQGVIIDKFRIDDEDKIALDSGAGIVGLPSHQLLMKRLSGVEIGSLVRVTLTGTEKNKKNQTYFIYKVEIGEVSLEGGE